jgi:class 3 adenylate cyclase
MGVNVGDSVEGAGIHGDGINVAARLGAMADPGGICLSSRVHEDAQGRLLRLGMPHAPLPMARRPAGADTPEASDRAWSTLFDVVISGQILRWRHVHSLVESLRHCSAR